jgi:hypothetical protein
MIYFNMNTYDINDLVANILTLIYHKDGRVCVVDGLNVVRTNKIEMDFSSRMLEMVDSKADIYCKTNFNSPCTKIIVYKNNEGKQLDREPYKNMVEYTKKHKNSIILYAYWDGSRFIDGETPTKLKLRLKNQNADAFSLYSRDDYVAVFIHEYLTYTTCSPVLYSQDMYRDKRSFNYIPPFDLYLLIDGKSAKFTFDKEDINISKLYSVIRYYNKKLKNISRWSGCKKGRVLCSICSSHVCADCGICLGCNNGIKKKKNYRISPKI